MTAMDPPIPAPAIRAVEGDVESEESDYCEEVDEFDDVLFVEEELLFDCEELPVFEEEFDDVLFVEEELLFDCEELPEFEEEFDDEFENPVPFDDVELLFVEFEVKLDVYALQAIESHFIHSMA